VKGEISTPNVYGWGDNGLTAKKGGRLQKKKNSFLGPIKRGGGAGGQGSTGKKKKKKGRGNS